MVKFNVEDNIGQSAPELQVPVAPKTSQGVIACGHAGCVINREARGKGGRETEGKGSRGGGGRKAGGQAGHSHLFGVSLLGNVARVADQE